MQNLERFVRQVESVDPRVTGHPIQTYYASRQMQTSYVHAAIYAAFAVAIVLMLDLRHIRHTLLASVPVVLGLLQMLGVLAWLDIPLNAANMIVLPLILGIGIDDGVHVIHDLRRQQGRYLPSLSTGMAVVLTSLTTMIADHQGVRSLGQVLTIGVFCCMLTSLFTLPAWLCLVTRRAAPQTAYSGSPSAAEPLPAEHEGGWRAATFRHRSSRFGVTALSPQPQCCYLRRFVSDDRAYLEIDSMAKPHHKLKKANHGSRPANAKARKAKRKKIRT
jgi:hypothetical protein